MRTSLSYIEAKKILHIGVPLIASQLVFSLSSFVSAAMVAHLGEYALSASILVSMVWMLVSVFLFGLLGSVSVLVSQKKGANDMGDISLVISQAFWISLIIGIPVMLALWYMPFVLRWSAQPPIVVHLATEYFRSVLWCVPSLVVLLVIEQFLTGIARTKIVLAVSLLEVPLEILIIYMFVFGKFGAPKLGVPGVGYGFAVAYFIAAVGLTTYVSFAKFAKPYQLFSSLNKLDKRYLQELFRIGWPIGMMYVIEIGAFTVATFFMARFGSRVLAADQIAFQYLGFTITIVFAMAQAITVRVGDAVGRQDLDSVKRSSYVGMFISFALMLVVAVFYIGYPHLLLEVDLGAHEKVNSLFYKEAVGMLAIIGVFQLFDNFRLNFVGALRGLKDTKIPMLISAISFWGVGVFASWLLGFHFHLGGIGIWYGLTAGIFIGAVILAVRFYRFVQHVDLSKILKIKS
jgi:multidrug resistance protein, MATE family